MNIAKWRSVASPFALFAMLALLGAPAGVAREDEKTDISPFFGTVVSQNVIFVIDTSNSMPNSGVVARIAGEPKIAKPPSGGKGVKIGDSGTRIELAKKELVHIIEDVLTEKVQFNIIAFDQKNYPWKTGLTPATKENKTDAVTFVNNLKLHAGTHSYEALAEALKDEKADTIYFLSDGVPFRVGPGALSWEENRKELNKIKELNKRKVVIHTIALIVGKGGDGKPEVRELMEKMMKTLAKEHGGTYRVIDSEKP